MATCNRRGKGEWGGGAKRRGRVVGKLTEVGGGGGEGVAKHVTHWLTQFLD